MKNTALNRQVRGLLEKIALAAAVAAVVAFGWSRLFKAARTVPAVAPASDETDDPDEMDTTEYLLSGANRAFVLAAIERHRRGEFVQHDLIEL